MSFTTSPPDCFLLFRDGESDNCNITSNIQQIRSTQIFPQFEKLFTRRLDMTVATSTSISTNLLSLSITVELLTSK